MTDLSIHADRDRWKAEAERLSAEVTTLKERLIREQEICAKFRERMHEAERLRIAQEYKCHYCRCGVDE